MKKIKIEDVKNRTSQVPIEKSIADIEKRLVSIGAKNINKQYDEDGLLVGIVFLVLINSETHAFKLEAKVDDIEAVMREQVSRPRPGTYEKIKDQANRTAWKLLKDWIDIQALMILFNQRSVLQTFLPDHYDVENTTTFFQRIEKSGTKLLNY